VCRRKTRIPDEGQDGAGNDVPIFIDVNRDDRLNLEDVLRAFMRTNIEIRKIVEWNDIEITDRVLSLLGEIRVARVPSVAEAVPGRGRVGLGFRSGETGSDIARLLLPARLAAGLPCSVLLDAKLPRQPEMSAFRPIAPAQKRPTRYLLRR
jgi:hypothetical protein